MLGVMTKKLSDETVRVWAQFVRVEQELLERVEADLKAVGLPPLVWYDVLLELAREPGGRLRHRDLHARMLLAKYNLSRLIDRMVAEGLVSREPVDDDARGAYIRVTDAGRKMQRRIWLAYGRAISQHFAELLDDADVQQLGRILSKLRG
jgi:DNA-binding MarR family transcriptional regulator